MNKLIEIKIIGWEFINGLFYTVKALCYNDGTVLYQYVPHPKFINYKNKCYYNNNIIKNKVDKIGGKKW